MPKQHYLAATYIGNFSLQEDRENRKRIIYVKRRNIARIYKQKAENVAYTINLYNETVDKSWTERNLSRAIDELINNDKKSLSAEMWLILVSFITELFIRGYEFNSRFRSRFWESNALDRYINIDIARIFERQRLYAPILYAEWLVFHNETKRPIITNDLGYCLSFDTHTKKYGYTFPLSKKAALSLTISERTKKRIVPIAVHNDKPHIIDIRHKKINKEEEIDGLNSCLNNYCLKEIYGPTEESVNHRMIEKRPAEFAMEPFFLVPPDDKNYLIDCEMDLFKLKAILGKLET